MKINNVGVTYSELRTFGNYENKRYGIQLEASLENGETATEVRVRLTEIAKKEVKKFFGDEDNGNPMDVPF
ncbi:hypothetical protein V1L52_10155 [Treponema sp. HNW]|uniref:hypothetical protein n=1 Tax=Treponema sp. HNW TaxID=3116654 RepID=UPI003D0F4E61